MSQSRCCCDIHASPIHLASIEKPDDRVSKRRGTMMVGRI